jgi:hypothetical protein
VIAQDYGCQVCWPELPESAYLAGRNLAIVADLIDESHYGVSIRRCYACNQTFLSVFTEQIDWTDGDDPQYWTRLPITESEASALMNAGEKVTSGMINVLGQDRRCLQCDYPKGKSKRIMWGVGFFVGPHD